MLVTLICQQCEIRKSNAIFDMNAYLRLKPCCDRTNFDMHKRSKRLDQIIVDLAKREQLIEEFKCGIIQPKTL